LLSRSHISPLRRFRFRTIATLRTPAVQGAE
jgi:hypothetical protein